MFSFQVNSTNLPEKLLNIPINLISGETTSLSEYEGKKSCIYKILGNLVPTLPKGDATL
jgi:hypothetical protein